MKKNRIWTRLAAALLVLVLALSMATGCAGTADGKTKNKSETQTEAVQETQEVKTPETTQAAATAAKNKKQDKGSTDQKDAGVDEDGSYTSKEEVAQYLHLYGHLPENYITKSEAKKLGWESSKGNLWEVAPGKSIGGDTFGNREGLLPEKKGRKYYECDIDYEGGYRGSDRIIYSNDGLVYFTGDHYNSFELLYGSEN